jgi:hypothetical protein
LDIIDSCPYHPETGVISDEQVIKEHEQFVEWYRQDGLLVE